MNQSDQPDITVQTPAKKEKKGSKRGVETLFRTSYRVHMDLSALADTKANIMISINGIIISIIIASISPKIDTNPWLIIPTSLLLLACLASVIYAVRSARPRVNSSVINLNMIREQKGNILFFGHYASLNEEEFLLGMREVLEDQTLLYDNMIKDIYGLGVVLSAKFDLLRKSYTMFMFGLTIGIIGFIAVYAWVVLFMDPSAASLDLVS